jgi:hypothetical protein
MINLLSVHRGIEGKIRRDKNIQDQLDRPTHLILARFGLMQKVRNWRVNNKVRAFFEGKFPFAVTSLHTSKVRAATW